MRPTESCQNVFRTHTVYDTVDRNIQKRKRVTEVMERVRGEGTLEEISYSYMFQDGCF
jgi:hypothetical protein